MLSINVLIITYNQQDIISRALDSILAQKEWGLNKIVICDDHSSDNNWLVIQEYNSKYPEYICAYRNENNLGIYRNAEKRITLRGKADLYIRMAGDDALCEGYFEALQNFCKDKEGIIRTSAVGIYGDWKSVAPNGKEIIRSNSAIQNNISPLTLKLRGKITNRSLAVTEKLLSNFKPIDYSGGLCWAEEQFDSQSQLLSDINYYLPHVGSIYYSGIGVSTRMNTLKYYKENMVKYSNMLLHYDLNEKDKNYVKQKLYYYSFIVNRNLLDLIRYKLFYYKSFLSFSEYNFVLSVKETYRTLRIAFRNRK